jgi:hypothetical protein
MGTIWYWSIEGKDDTGRIWERYCVVIYSYELSVFDKTNVIYRNI